MTPADTLTAAVETITNDILDAFKHTGDQSVTRAIQRPDIRTAVKAMFDADGWTTNETADGVFVTYPDALVFDVGNWDEKKLV